MTELPFKTRMEVLGLRLPTEAEVPKLEELVKDLDRAAAFIRSIERSYAEEPVNVFSLAPKAA
ncbi:hypothetical protein [Prosthecomicrobium sp. N25]|uniref:hypothetical protein n=1 Tax=Prosthecomicrobium sp. N25 TaxID=3129254 RepID=UPI00307765CA